MTDIVERLRRAIATHEVANLEIDPGLVIDAATEIERLRAALRAAEPRELTGLEERGA